MQHGSHLSQTDHPPSHPPPLSVSASSRRRFRPSLERLEDRWVPAPLNVTSAFDDGGAGTLRSIIAGATNGDTITFDPSLNGRTITLTRGEIAFGKSLTIDGTNTNITISGNNTSRIFDITGQGLTETISNLKFVSGKAPGTTEPNRGLGGAIYAQGSLTLNNDWFESNTAVNAGGAVYSIGVGGSLSVTGSTFKSNSVTGVTAAGGAIAVPSATDGHNVTLTNTAFTLNTSSGSGGAVYAIGPANTTLQVTGCNFTNNSVTAPAPFAATGGAIDTTDQLTVSGGTFTGNQATNAGGAIAYGPGTPTTSMTLTNVAFTNNTAENGGAINSLVDSAQGSVTVSVVGCLFNGNRATGPVADSASITGGAISIFQDTGGSASASFTVVNSTFFQNQSDTNGGAIALRASNTGTGTNTVSLTSLTVYQNQAELSGGGLWLSLSGTQPPVVRNSIFAGNTLAVGAAADGFDVYGQVNSVGFNLVGQTEGSNGWIANDQKGSAANPLDPGLDPNGLAFNGGPTQTLKVLTTSKAYRNGDPNMDTLAAPLNKDQRGYTRQHNKVSVGAYDPDATQ